MAIPTKAKVKFNGGRGALLCERCNIIIKADFDPATIEDKYHYCSNCNEDTMLYDPPSGWLYGFPKPYLPKENESLAETLLRDGYPLKELCTIVKDGEVKGVRFIGTGSALKAIHGLKKDPLVAEDCHCFDGVCDCESIGECKYG